MKELLLKGDTFIFRNFDGELGPYLLFYFVRFHSPWYRHGPEPEFIIQLNNFKLLKYYYIHFLLVSFLYLTSKWRVELARVGFIYQYVVGKDR